MKINKKITKIGLIILTTILVVSSLIYFKPQITQWFRCQGLDPAVLDAGKGLNSYNIYVDFNPDNKELNCTQTVEYRNSTQKSLTHIYFHLYPNAFKYENKPAFPADEMSRAYPNGFSEGYIDIEEIKVNGIKAKYSISGYTDNLLMIVIDDLLKPDEKATIHMKYTVKLPECMGRFGYGEKTFKAANWYPIAAVYDERGWSLDPYYPIGDPFYSDVANYKVTIKAPKGFIIASTGEEFSSKSKDDYTIREIEAFTVRDFAFIASNQFKVASKEVGDTTVFSYYFSEDYGEKALIFAADALRVFNKVFCPYPYSTFTVVETDFFIGGMEYPNLIMLDRSLYSGVNLNWLELVTAHETAHQWWCGLVGNDQINNSWMDEALTEYSTVLYYGLIYDSKKEMEVYNSLIGEGKYNIYKALMDTLDKDETIHKPVYEFSSLYTYDALVYGKGAMMFHQLRQELGDELFFDALKKYLDKYKFKNATPEDMISTFSQVSGKDLTYIFDAWLYNK